MSTITLFIFYLLFLFLVFSFMSFMFLLVPSYSLFFVFSSYFFCVVILSSKVIKQCFFVFFSFVIMVFKNSQVVNNRFLRTIFSQFFFIFFISFMLYKNDVHNNFFYCIPVHVPKIQIPYLRLWIFEIRKNLQHLERFHHE